MKHIYLSKIFL